MHTEDGLKKRWTHTDILKRSRRPDQISFSRSHPQLIMALGSYNFQKRFSKKAYFPKVIVRMHVFSPKILRISQIKSDTWFTFPRVTLVKYPFIIPILLKVTGRIGMIKGSITEQWAVEKLPASRDENGWISGKSHWEYKIFAMNFFWIGDDPPFGLFPEIHPLWRIQASLRDRIDKW